MWCFFKFSDINNSLSIYSHVPGGCTMLIFAKLRADESQWPGNHRAFLPAAGEGPPEATPNLQP